jgi:ComF family protein
MRRESRFSGRWIAAGLGRLRRSVLDALFPRRCLACQALYLLPADMAEEGILNAFFCPVCREEICAVAAPLCLCCGVPFRGQEQESHRCGRCLANPPHFEMARAAGRYQGGLKLAVKALKFRSRVELAPALARLLDEAHQRFFQDRTADLVVPVPLHPVRMRRRGFNQAYTLLRAWRQLWEDDKALVMNRHLLVRRRPTVSQTGLDRKRRRANVKGAFVVTEPEMAKDKKILLVDDVMTTGATVDECARVLRAVGAERVDVLTLARA